MCASMEYNASTAVRLIMPETALDNIEPGARGGGRSEDSMRHRREGPRGMAAWMAMGPRPVRFVLD